MSIVMESPPHAESAEAAAKPRLFNTLFTEVVFETHAYVGKSRRVSRIKATLNGRDVDQKRVGKPVVSFLPEALTKKINAAREEIAGVLERYTLPCGKDGSRLVPVHNCSEFVAAWEAAEAAFEAVAREVADSYDQIVAYNRDHWRPEFETDLDYEEEIGKLLPKSAEHLRSKFWVERRFRDPDDLADRFEDFAVKEFFATCRANAERFADELDDALRRGPLEKLAAALAAAKDKLAAAKKLTPQSFTDVAAALTLCRSCRDALPPEIHEIVERLAGQVTTVVGHAERSKQAGGGTTAAIKKHERALTAVFDEAVAACGAALDRQDMVERFGHLPRGLGLLAGDDEE